MKAAIVILLILALIAALVIIRITDKDSHGNG